MIYSVVIPVYKNAPSIPELIDALAMVDRTINDRSGIGLEAVFVVDGSPDDSFSVLSNRLPGAPFRSQLLLHARNFGSFAAIRTGLRAASGEYFGMIAADLQEPPELLVAFLEELAGDRCDIAIGVREGREDPALTRLSSGLFWHVYRTLIMPAIPEGGVDLFGCSAQVRDELLKLDELHSSLVGLVYWLGFRRKEVLYRRRARRHGRSSWTFRKKIDYLLDSVFAFTDLPIRLLTIAGFCGISLASLFGLAVLVAKVFGSISVSGYATTILVIVFFGALNTLGVGLVGHYAWRAYENTKGRPIAIVHRHCRFQGLGERTTERHTTERG